MMWIQQFLLTFLVLNIFQSFAERIHKVHNVVLFRDQKSFCNLTPIQQIITSPGYETVTIENNICVGACYSYSIPKTLPADPGEIISPYCDSCQPNITECYHVNLTADASNLSGPSTIKKRVEIILSCECKTCNVDPVSCDLSEDGTVDLPDHLYVTKDKVQIQYQEIPDILEAKSNASKILHGSKQFELDDKLMKLLRKIQNGDRDISKYDWRELEMLLRLVDGSEILSDQNVLEFVNYVNANNSEDFELDVNKLKEVLLAYEKSKNIIEKSDQFWTGFSDNSKIEEDIKQILKKHNLDDSLFGIEGNRLGMKHRFTGSHISMGIKSPPPTVTEPRTETTTQNNEQNHHHHLMEEGQAGLERGHLIKGPHGSLVLNPDIPTENKLNIQDHLKQNHLSSVVTYEDQEKNDSSRD